MAFASITADATWVTRSEAKIIRPALFLYLDWPTEEVRASTHHKEITTTDDSVSPSVQETWKGAGEASSIEAPNFKRNGALMTYKVGLTSLPQESVNDETEASAIGRRATLHLGLFDEAWENPVLKRIFIGHIITAGDFKFRRDDNGDWVVDASIEISNGRSPRRHLQNHHSPETAETGDTAWRLLPTVGRSVTWPN